MEERSAAPAGVSVIVPAYNEESILESTIDRLDRALAALGRPYEIVVADDCSRDGTYDVGASCAKRNPRVKVVRHTPNRGKGAAIRTGFAATTLPIVAYIDADIHTDSATLAEYVASLEAGHDIVLANKWDPASNVDYSFFRRFASTAYGAFAKVLFWVPIVDTQCGFKFFRRPVLERAMPHLTIDRFGFDIELLAWCVRDGSRIAALPISIAEIRESKVDHVEVLKMFKDLLIARVRMWQQGRREPPTAARAPHMIK